MKSYYFDEDQKFTIGTDAKKAQSIATKRITSCSNISWKAIEYDEDGDEIPSGVTLDNNGITLNETVTCGAVVSDNSVLIGLLPVVDYTVPEGHAAIFVNSSNQLCCKAYGGEIKILANLL